MGFQSKASNHRLGQPRAQNPSLHNSTVMSVNSRFKKPAPGVSKGKTLLAEMKAAKEDSGRIKITAGLYMLSRGKNGAETMKKVLVIYLFVLI